MGETSKRRKNRVVAISCWRLSHHLSPRRSITNRGGARPRPLQKTSRFGELEWTRPYWVCGAGHGGWTPADDTLGLGPEHFTPALARWSLSRPLIDPLMRFPRRWKVSGMFSSMGKRSAKSRSGWDSKRNSGSKPRLPPSRPGARELRRWPLYGLCIDPTTGTPGGAPSPMRELRGRSPNLTIGAGYFLFMIGPEGCEALWGNSCDPSFSSL